MIKVTTTVQGLLERLFSYIRTIDMHTQPVIEQVGGLLLYRRVEKEEADWNNPENNRWDQRHRYEDKGEEFTELILSRLVSFYNLYFLKLKGNFMNVRYLFHLMDLIEDIHTRMEMDWGSHYNSLETDGLIFDYLVDKHYGQTFTNGVNLPSHIVRFMTHLADPQMEECVLDPSCGSGGFLLSAMRYMQTDYYREDVNEDFMMRDADGFEYIPQNVFEEINRDSFSESLYGVEKHEDRYRLACLRNLLYLMDHTAIVHADFIYEKYGDNTPFEVILTNPPFGGKLVDMSPDFRILSRIPEIQFMDKLPRSLAPGGRAVVIMPDGFLSNGAAAYKQCRTNLLLENRLEAVISLPAGIFKPYTDAKAAILIFTRRGTTEDVWFYELESDGYSLDMNRRRLKGDPLPEAVELFRARFVDKNYDVSRRAFFVPLAEIEANGYVLNYKRYHGPEIVKQEVRDSSDVLNEIVGLENALLSDLYGLKKMIEWRE